MDRLRSLILALVAGAVAVTPAYAAQPQVTTMAGTIHTVDEPAGRFTLRSSAGELTVVSVSPEVLSRLQTGTAVEVLQAGPNAIIIRRLAKATLPTRPAPLSPPASQRQGP
ncbi:MAG: hypothetical protein AB7N91_11015 [Candidatus Tectimicrobiota bacterium]